jgi:XTP/dITP diphosphohydrolase
VKLLVATRSAHKLSEIRHLLASVPGLVLIDPGALGIAPSDEEEAIEAFDTFEENARAKARWFRERTGYPTLADDSGLEVDALDGAPGVWSRRFAPGEFADREAQDRANNEHLLERLGELPLAQRTARFVCVAALDLGDGEPRLFRGEVPGLIVGRPQGWSGFGYDPLFLDQGLGRTFAQLTPAEKNERSHRGRAFRALAEALRDLDTPPESSLPASTPQPAAPATPHTDPHPQDSSA